MSAHTAIHVLVERCRAGEYAGLVCKLPSGWLVMGEQQVLPGYCLLLPDPVVAHLNALASASRTQFLSDMALAGDALLRVTAAIRINYALFGNVEPALHAHLFPRLPSEAEQSRALQPFALDWKAAPRFSEAQHGALKLRVAQEVRRRASSPEG